jgi:hypothetical protein
MASPGAGQLLLPKVIRYAASTIIETSGTNRITMPTTVPYLAFPNNAPAAVKGSRSSRAERSGSARDGSELLTNRQLAIAVIDQQAAQKVASKTPIRLNRGERIGLLYNVTAWLIVGSYVTYAPPITATELQNIYLARITRLGAITVALQVAATILITRGRPSS